MMLPPVTLDKSTSERVKRMISTGEIRDEPELVRESIRLYLAQKESEKALEREPKIYWVSKGKDEKGILVFDAGHFGGYVHVYEHKESVEANNIMEEMKKYYKVKDLSSLKKGVVRSWIEKKYGFPIDWRISTF